MKKIIPNAFPCPPWEIHVAPEKLGPSQSNNSSGPPIWMKALQPIHFYYENKNAHPMLVFGNFNMSTLTFPMHVPRSNLCKNFAWILFIKWNECRYVIWVNLWNNFNFQVWLDKTLNALDNNKCGLNWRPRVFIQVEFNSTVACLGESQQLKSSLTSGDILCVCVGINISEKITFWE